jgi:hypothetical protein
MKLRGFGKKQVNGTTVPLDSPLQPVIPLENSLVLYRNLTDLPLSKYIDGVVNGNVSAIIKSGTCNDESELIEAWTDITQQYAEAIGDQEQKLFLSLFIEINKLSVAIEQIASLVKALGTCYVKEFANKLNLLLSTSFKFDVFDKAGYDKDLQRCLNRSKGYQIQLDLKLSQFQSIQKKESNPGIGPDHAYFQSILLTLSQYVKYEVNETRISVFQFCEMIKRLNKHLELMSKK